MDSKSIPRKGVGVRLPSLALTPGTDDPAARALSPVLLPAVRAGLRRSTSALEATTRALRARPRAGAAAETLTSLEETDADVARWGWCLSLLAAAQGADLLGARRERQGLRWIARTLEEALPGLALVPASGALPELPRARADARRAGQTDALHFGWCLLAAHAHGARGLAWRQTSGGGWGYWIELDLGPQACEPELLVAARAGGEARWVRYASGWLGCRIGAGA